MLDNSSVRGSDSTAWGGNRHPRSIIIIRHGQTEAITVERVGRFFKSAKDIVRRDSKARRYLRDDTLKLPGEDRAGE